MPEFYTLHRVKYIPYPFFADENSEFFVINAKNVVSFFLFFFYIDNPFNIFLIMK